MGWFGKSKDRKELREIKEAKKQLKHLERYKKEKRMTTSAADPTRAINELQPWQVNQEKTNPALSQLVHRDIWGREIKEPDLTNPTRNRWERPLDTIRGFQEAVDRGYRRSYHDEAATSVQDGSSQYGGHQHGGSAGGPSNDAAYTHVPSRMGNSATPLSSGSADEPLGFGAMGGRTTLNDNLAANAPVMSHRARNYSHGSNGYADTGYESVGHGSRGSSNNLEGESSWGAPQNGFPMESVPRKAAVNVIKLSNQPTTVTPTTVAPAAKNPAVVTASKKKKGWLGKRLSKQ